MNNVTPDTPSNPLRLMTGIGQGITMGSLLLPVANAMLWDDTSPTRTLDNFWHLLGLLGVGAVVAGMLLSGLDIFLYPLAVLSAVGVVAIMTLIFTVVITSLLRRENKSHTLADAMPLLMLGLTGSLVLIGLIDLCGSWRPGMGWLSGRRCGRRMAEADGGCIWPALWRRHDA
jgi:hypothetical protein